MFLRIAIGGTPPVAEFSRTAGVPDDLWFAIPINLGPGVMRGHGEQLLIPIERFLAGRRWLSDACRRHGVGVQLDEAALGFLRRAQAEQAFVLERLAGRVREPAPEQFRADETLGSRELFWFQKRDLEKLLTLEHGANFSVPGAGKTAVTYALYQAERDRGRVQRLLVVAPLSAYEAWETELESCFTRPPVLARFEPGHTDAEVLLINYQKLASAQSELAHLLLESPTHLVLDEAHRMKRGRLGEWGNACLDLAHLAARRDILTGTPAPHSPRDFIALIDFVWPGMSRTILPEDALRRDPPDDAMARVNQSLQPLFVRTRKSELGLDPPTMSVDLVPPGPLQADIYDALRSRYAGMFDMDRRDSAVLGQMGEVTMYLLEAATNPALLGLGPSQGLPIRYPPLAIPPGSRLADLIARYGNHEIPPKFVRLAQLVERNASNNRKTLIWSNFIGNLLTLEQMLARYQPALIYGGIPLSAPEGAVGVRTRKVELARFRDDEECMVLLANPAATAEGISLHETCHDAIYLERTFNAGQYLQSVDRIHRLGLAPGVQTSITFLLTQGTIDETVDGRVRLKAERLAQMLDDADLVTMALPDEDDYGEVLDDVEDLEALFGHLAGQDG